MGYVDSMSLVSFAVSDPIGKRDSTGQIVDIGERAFRGGMAIAGLPYTPEFPPWKPIPPVSEWFWYGNHCGKNHGNGSATGGGATVPDGGTDACCLAHDDCYREFGVSWHPCCEDRSPGENSCNLTLCLCALSVTPASAVEAAAQAAIIALMCNCVSCDLSSYFGQHVDSTQK